MHCAAQAVPRFGCQLRLSRAASSLFPNSGIRQSKSKSKGGALCQGPEDFRGLWVSPCPRKGTQLRGPHTCKGASGYTAPCLSFPVVPFAKCPFSTSNPCGEKKLKVSWSGEWKLQS